MSEDEKLKMSLCEQGLSYNQAVNAVDVVRSLGWVPTSEAA